MDRIDEKILKIVGMNSRVNINHIAKVVGKSKETVNYRLNRMMKDETILFFYANINGGKLGYSYYKILLKYNTMSFATEKIMLAFLKKNKNMLWVGNCDGEYQLMISLLVRNLRELNDFLKKFFNKFGEYLRKKEILQVTAFDVLNENYLDAKSNEKLSVMEDVTCKPESADEVDLEILRILSGEARIKLVDIAEKMNMTAEGVSYRIKNLVGKRIISNFKTRVNYSKLGYLYYQVLFSVNDFVVRQQIVDKFTKHSSCVSIVKFVGKYDLQLEIIVKDVKELRSIMDNLRKGDEFGAVVLPV